MLGRKLLTASFAAVDKDNSGSIELGELESLCKSIDYPIDAKEVTDLFNEIDTNHDGKISLNEFIAWYRLGKNSDLRKILKKNLRHISEYETNIQHKLKKCESIDLSGRKSLVDIVFIDGEPGCKSEWAMKAGFQDNKETINLIANALPALKLTPESDEQFLVSFIMKSKNPEALKTGLEAFINTTLDLLVEKAGPGFQEIVDATAWGVGIDGDRVIFALNLIENPMAVAYYGMASQMCVMLSGSGLSFDMLLQAACNPKEHLKLKNWFEHTDGSKFTMDLNVLEGGVEGLKQLIDGMAGQREPMINFAVNLFNNIKFKFITNSNVHAGGGEKGLDNMIEAMNHAMKVIPNCPNFTIDSTKIKSKNWDEALDEFRNSQPLSDIKRLVNDHPMISDLYECLLENGLNDCEFYGILDSACLTEKWRFEGMKEMFGDLWNIIKN